ncbi:uncharacterized protein LOC131659837 [Vicia villosa]|uniref:uncharacterized protein LOC131659837 n=1 Tax=Vicia villosa TaxID=3911 RepID=UPI00273BB5A1|nr:uncharacterized protein LOC131659837 [Vicia villosa]
MENSSASAFSDDEIQNNMNMGSCITDFHFSPALPSCSVFNMPPPPSPLSDPNLSDASFSSYMDDFNAFYWFSDFNFETGTSESLPAATQTDLQQPVSDSSSIPSSYNEAGAVAVKPVGAVAVKPVVAAAENEDRLQLVEGKGAEDHGGDHRIEAVENPNDQNQAKKT